jgi:anti-sigma factor RsiW
MTHEDVLATREAYVDGELDAASSLAVEAHFAACQECHAWLEARRALRAQLASPALRHAVPDGLGERIAGSLRERRPSLRRASVWPAALAAGLVLAIGGFLLGRTYSGSADPAQGLAAAHVRAVLSSHIVDVASSDHHAVKPWFAGRLPFSPPVPELDGQLDVLLGGRVDFVDHTRVAALAYQHGNHVIDVFVWPRSAALGARQADRTIDGYHVQTTEVGEFRAAFVSDASKDELLAFRNRWRAAAQ